MPSPSNSPTTHHFAKFALVGGSGVIVNMGLLHLLTAWGGLDYRVSGLIAIECAIVNNFCWNLLWTFRERKPDRKRHIGAMFIKFNCSSGLVAFVINWGLLVVFASMLHLHYLIANLIGIAFGTAANFMISSLWTFTHRKQARPEAI